METARGMEYGTVSIGTREIPEEQIKAPLKPILRKATPEDEETVIQNQVREREAFNICQRRIQRHGLEMNLVDVEFTFDINKIIFYFTADGGGIGSCGRPLCCASWLGDFEPVSIRMAKNQNLSLNPTKISGSCGRLMCCLKYEDYMYAKEKGKGSRPRKEYAEAPQVGSMVATSMGKGKVTTVNKAKHTATVQLSPDNVVTLEWDELIDASQAMDDD